MGVKTWGTYSKLAMNQTLWISLIGFWLFRFLTFQVSNFLGRVLLWWPTTKINLLANTPVDTVFDKVFLNQCLSLRVWPVPTKSPFSGFRWWRFYLFVSNRGWEIKGGQRLKQISNLLSDQPLAPVADQQGKVNADIVKISTRIGNPN